MSFPHSYGLSYLCFFCFVLSLGRHFPDEKWKKLVKTGWLCFQNLKSPRNTRDSLEEIRRKRKEVEFLGRVESGAGSAGCGGQGFSPEVW